MEITLAVDVATCGGSTGPAIAIGLHPATRRRNGRLF
jgi:hypothetical protein